MSEKSIIGLNIPNWVFLLKKLFYTLDTNGRYSKCKELDELYNVLTCKISINLHIKMWAEEYLEYRTSKLPEEIAYSNLFLDDIITEFGFPVWVEQAIVKQAEKLSKSTK